MKRNYCEIDNTNPARAYHFSGHAYAPNCQECSEWDTLFPAELKASCLGIYVDSRSLFNFKSGVISPS